jgi:diguanylate cyclase (GGDEF)-like protein
VALAADERAAWAAITREISRALAVPAWVIEEVGQDRRIVDEAGREASPDIDEVLRQVDLGAWTTIRLADKNRSTALVVAGNAATLGPVLGTVAGWVPGVLAAVRERDRRARVDALLVDVYKLARRTGRSGEIDAVCQQVVEQASRTLGAERVAVALYRPDEQRLVLVAACGYALDAVKDVRIQPGEWVMGHVYACRRAVLVRDVRRFRALSAVMRRYRSVSFAAVPIVADGRVVGVLSATDKVDAGTFTRQDVAKLRAIAGVAALGLVAARREAEAARLTHAATIDSLTGLFNRQSFDVRLRQEIERARRSSGTLAVLMIDVDDFKAINDAHGHPVGDAVLQAVSDVLRSVVRLFDVCGRYGGDEFAIVMPNSQGASTSAAAERIRERLSTSHERDPRLIGLRRVTVSVGVATISDGETAEEIVQRADDSLYRAKAAGKNCVRIAPSRAPRPQRPTMGRFNERPPRR